MKGIPHFLNFGDRERLQAVFPPLLAFTQWMHKHRRWPEGGDYWRGSIWPPTNYMVLRGLTKVHEDALAHEIAVNHVDNVTKAFQETGTLWENYAPEAATRGSLSSKDFVGWGGVPPIAVLIEYVFGLRADAAEKRLLWDVRLLDSHGIKRYPFGADGSLDLFCAGRKSEDEEPRIEATSTVPVKLVVRWKKGEKEIKPSCNS
jgi:hypothetical protein